MAGTMGGALGANSVSAAMGAVGWPLLNLLGLDFLICPQMVLGEPVSASCLVRIVCLVSLSCGLALDLFGFICVSMP